MAPNVLSFLNSFWYSTREEVLIDWKYNITAINIFSDTDKEPKLLSQTTLVNYLFPNKNGVATIPAANPAAGIA